MSLHRSFSAGYLERATAGVASVAGIALPLPVKARGSGSVVTSCKSTRDGVREIVAIDIDCDMGEAYSIYKRGDDEAIVPCITSSHNASQSVPWMPNSILMLCNYYKTVLARSQALPYLLALCVGLSVGLKKWRS